jgi:molybdate transport system substrate-binding protein
MQPRDRNGGSVTSTSIESIDRSGVRAPRRTAMILPGIRRHALGVLTALALIATTPLAAAQQQPVIVFAAASMKTVIDDLNTAFTRNTGIKVSTSYAASSALARQIEQGAPADVFISADIPWMDHVQKHDLINPKSRFDLAGNRLVLIAPKESKISRVDIAQGFDLAALAGTGRIAVGEVKSVPAGRYARAALEKLGSWAAVEGRLAMADNVRAALILVARGEAPLGIVYETDAKAEPGVKVIGAFPAGSHPAIVYPAAATAKAQPAADKYLAFLRSGTAVVAFEGHGFTYLVKAGP